MRFDHGFAKLHVAGFEIKVRVCEVRVCSMCAVGRDSLQIGAIILVLVRLGRAVESDVTVTEQGMEVIDGHGHRVSQIKIFPRA